MTHTFELTDAISFTLELFIIFKCSKLINLTSNNNNLKFDDVTFKKKTKLPTKPIRIVYRVYLINLSKRCDQFVQCLLSSFIAHTKPSNVHIDEGPKHINPQAYEAGKGWTTGDDGLAAWWWTVNGPCGRWSCGPLMHSRIFIRYIRQTNKSAGILWRGITWDRLAEGRWELNCDHFTSECEYFVCRSADCIRMLTSERVMWIR